MEMQNVFADVEKYHLSGFNHISSHGAEWKALNVVVFDDDKALVFRLERDHFALWIIRTERADPWLGPCMENKAVRIRMPIERDAEKIHDLAFVPGHQGANIRDAWHVFSGQT